MIIVNEESPRWLRELARFVTIKNLLFVYGNVHDLVSFPIRLDGPDPVRWTESDLRGFFQRFLSGLKYEVIGWADAVDDLSFPSPEMEDLFHRVEAGRELPGEEKPDDRKKADPAQQRPSLPREPREPRPSEPADWNRTISRIARGLQNSRVPCAFVIDLASRLTSSPDRLSKDERILFTRVLKAAAASREVVRPEGRWNNLLILVCDKMNDLPAFLYLNNPRARSINIELPDREERARFVNRYYRHFFGALPNAAPPPAVVRDFVDLSEGLTNYEMRSLVNLSLKERIPICDPETGVPNVKRISEMYKYGVTTSEWDKIEAEKLASAESFIRSRIKGQENAVVRVLDIVKRAKIGLAAGDSSRSNRPRGVLFFAGPTGVGKTEMAKALAALLFGQEERLIRFDMSEYAAPQSDQRLLGAPPGYVGYEEGGQLTNAVKKNPFAILLFDEIEKAHGSIFDKFLQILDDGRLTDGKGETIYFSECIIIFTSNLGAVARGEAAGGAGAKWLVTPDMPYARMRDIILDAIHDHFNFVLGRPEILNRFGDNFVVFDFIKAPLDEQIVDLLIGKLVKAAREGKKMELIVEPKVRNALVALARQHLQHGGRGIRNAIDSALVNPLSRVLFDRNVQPHALVRVQDLIDRGEEAATRFDLTVEVQSGATSLPGGNH
ncbi:MAG TPA: AAA family ATPase [Candidatus Hydrogenedentes bacterium]|nr:AAA family ATPase [Candidatus Hydrogenedentota bacterium]